MPMDSREARLELDRMRHNAHVERQRLDLFERYHRGHHDWPYQPSTATVEFKTLAERAITNLLPLVVDTLVERLYVDGYRPEVQDDANSRAWDWWQANGLDSRQKQLYETVAINGYGFVLVLPGDPVPWMRPASARSWHAEYVEPDDDWPTRAVRMDAGGKTARLLDADALYVMERSGNRWDVSEVWEHGLGVCPLVRFRCRWDLDHDHPIGEVEPLLRIQDRLNQTVFDLLVAQTYASVPQKYITGLVEQDDQSIAHALAKRVWTFDEPGTEVGQLGEANLNNIVQAISNTLRVYGLVSKTPPHYLLGEIVNLSAEALTAADTSLSKKVEDRQTVIGESWEQALRLAGVAAGDEEAAGDHASQVVWRDTDPRALSSTVDALSKMVEGLQVPPEMTWPMIPGWTQQDVERAQAIRQEGDPLAQVEEEIARQLEGHADA